MDKGTGPQKGMALQVNCNLTCDIETRLRAYILAKEAIMSRENIICLYNILFIKERDSNFVLRRIHTERRTKCLNFSQKSNTRAGSPPTLTTSTALWGSRGVNETYLLNHL